MIYLDSSAIIKLLVDEDESAALSAWMTDHEGIPVMSSELAKVEVIRAARRLGTNVPRTRSFLAELDMVGLSGDLLDQAADLHGPFLRTLDAIHLASALAIGAALTDFLSYDHRLFEAAEAAGLAPSRPGQMTAH